uniref:phosphate-starvation-inducible PsiE family protein n=1 Tax=Thaumasiovibrio occultus TaxID=1891184 RepID=UPI000B3608BD|nr:phosphate-starvation-inducible PsiE family protein [Thaumasiovibrio occultus]
MMVVLIVMGVIDVGWEITQKLFIKEPRFVLTVTDLLKLFGAFMVILIAIEIFINITVYLREEVIHVKIVIATALMAIARKIIILDMQKYDAWQVAALAAVFFASAIAYWYVHRIPVEELATDDPYKEKSKAKISDNAEANTEKSPETMAASQEAK